MKNLLPFVYDDIGFSVANSIDEDDPKTWCKVYLHIKRVNPKVADVISKWSSLVGVNKEGKLNLKIMGILVYKLLESQAECDRMEKELKIR